MWANFNVWWQSGQIRNQELGNPDTKQLNLFSLIFSLTESSHSVSQSVSQTLSQSVGQCVYDLTLCPPVGMSLSSPLDAGTQMAWGSSDQGEGLSVCQTDSSSAPEAHYQAAATATTTTATQPPDDCMQLTTHNTKHKPICNHFMPLISGKMAIFCGVLL